MIKLDDLVATLPEEDGKEFVKNYRMYRSDFKSGGAGWCWLSDEYYPIFKKYYQPNIIDEHGETFVTSMVKSGKVNNLRMLLHSGEDVNQKNVRGLTPLMLAAMGNYPIVVRRLLEAGADKSITNNDGKTALELAEMFGATRCVKYLSTDEWRNRTVHHR